MEEQQILEEQQIKAKLKAIDHVQTFVIHLFRSETARETALRGRLDVTTGGAVVVTSGLISFYFTNPNVSHIILLASVLLIFVFLMVEARRFLAYVIIKDRVRHLEKDYIAPLFNEISLEPKTLNYAPHANPDLVESLINNKPLISFFEAAAWRLRKIYIYLFGVLYVIWLDRILRDRADQAWLDHINQAAAILQVPGVVVFFLFGGLMLAGLIVGLSVAHVDKEFDYL